MGPFISGSLFSAAVRVEPKGEALAFGLFGGISFVGFLLSFGIRGEQLESDDWGEEDDENETDEEQANGEDDRLLSRPGQRS